MSFMETCRQSVRGRNLRIVYPEGHDERAVAAARQLAAQDLGVPIVLGSDPIEGVETHDPASHPQAGRLAEVCLELRRHKGMTEEQACELVKQPHFLGALMVREGLADGMVSGLRSETKPFLPAFQMVKMRPGMSKASSVFIMCWPDKTYFYADCSVNIDPDPETLASIAIATADTVKALGHEPRIAFLSFSTRGSAEHTRVDKVTRALQLAREQAPHLIMDGEMQFDAAILPSVAERKSPGSAVAGQANVFIFPDLDAGNIAYKITERLGGASAVGPILQGLNKPVNDVSRGCSVQDLVDVSVITGLQAMAGKPSKL
ncbi:MAG: phosphate acetyltransferase [Vulcanimicrobiota bacterium]